MSDTPVVAPLKYYYRNPSLFTDASNTPAGATITQSGAGCSGSIDSFVPVWRQVASAGGNNTTVPFQTGLFSVEKGVPLSFEMDIRVNSFGAGGVTPWFWDGVQLHLGTFITAVSRATHTVNIVPGANSGQFGIIRNVGGAFDLSVFSALCYRA